MCTEKNPVRLGCLPFPRPKPVVFYDPVLWDAEGQAKPNLWLMASLQKTLTWTCLLHCYQITVAGEKPWKKVIRFCSQATFLNFPSKLLSFSSHPLPCVDVLEKPQTGDAQDDVTQAQSWQMLLLVAVQPCSSPSTLRGPCHHLLLLKCRFPHIPLVLIRNIRVTPAEMIIIPCSWVMILVPSQWETGYWRANLTSSRNYNYPLPLGDDFSIFLEGNWLLKSKPSKWQKLHQLSQPLA